MTILQQIIKDSHLKNTELAKKLGICDMSLYRKITGVSKITPPEMLMLQQELNLTDEQIKNIQEELNGSI